MKKIFISYAHSDKKIVEALTRQLQDLSYDVWIDTRKLRGGSFWSDEIENGIVNCDVFLLFISIRSMKSRYVRKEIRTAISNKKYIVTLRLEQTDIPRRLKSPLEDIQWVDYEQPGWKSRLLVAFDKNENTQSEQKRRFEGAMPKIAQVKKRTELRGMISLLESEGLRAHLPENSRITSEITKQDVKNDNIPLRFPVDKSTNTLLDLILFVSVNAPDFDVESTYKKIIVPPYLDSGVFSFFLTPRKVNDRALVTLELFQEEEKSTLIGSLTITTEIESLQREMAKAFWNYATSRLTVVIPESEKSNLTYLRSVQDIDQFIHFRNTLDNFGNFVIYRDQYQELIETLSGLEEFAWKRSQDNYRNQNILRIIQRIERIQSKLATYQPGYHQMDHFIPTITEEIVYLIREMDMMIEPMARTGFNDKFFN